MKFKFELISILLFSAFILIQCASEAAPGGGPPDKTPPQLINVSVKTGSTGVPMSQEIVFYFSETINPDNLDKNVTLFPLGGEGVKIRNKARSISVAPATAWDTSIVYTLILGKGISDIRGNGIEQPIQISFTSGSEIPQNMIMGKVRGLEANTTAVIMISQRYVHPDSIILSPQYYTQTGPEGDFSFKYLPSTTFNIAGYIDLDKSNSYKAKFDGVCIPVTPDVLPDTSLNTFIMQAVYENFSPGVAIMTESTDPLKTDITFSKMPGSRNGPENFTFDSFPVDTVIFHENICSIYHQEAQNDSFFLSMATLVDQVGINFVDTTFYLPAVDWPDSFFHFEQLGNYLRITPDPGISTLTAVFQSRIDTSEISLFKHLNGFYRLPQTKVSRQGTCLLSMPFLNEQTLSDSTYSVKVNIAAIPEYGAVIGTVDSESYDGLTLVLHHEDKSYEHSVIEKDFSFAKVLPGTYDLSYYIDKNKNSFRDLGNPFPHSAPELLRPLDTKIEVRARWDTELEEPYKIVVENGK